jgi:peptidoglycan/xylan/chitin deacetylase (PgdA/CDA1 family)
MKTTVIGLFCFLLLFQSNVLSESPKDHETESTEIPVLMYHILIEGRNDGLSVDPIRFKEQMTSLKEAGYNTITVFQLDDYLKNGTPLPTKPILITFDDGYISNYEKAYPVLKELDMKATIYVIASSILEGDTAANNEKITWAQAKQMRNVMTIQSHTWDSHNQAMTASGKMRGLIASPKTNESQSQFEQRVYDDLVKSKNIIEEKLGYSNISIAYPFGDYSEDTMKLAEKAGYSIGFTIKQGTVTKEDNALKLNRIRADGSYTGEKLIKIIENFIAK